MNRQLQDPATVGRPIRHMILTGILLLLAIPASSAILASPPTRPHASLPRSEQWLPAGEYALPAYLETGFLPEGKLQYSAGGTLFLYGGTNPFLSPNEGETWTALADPAYWANEAAMVPSPTFEQDRFLVVGLEYGVEALLYSADAGLTWHQPTPTVDGPVRAVAFSPTFHTDQTVFAAADNPYRILRSTNAGQNWAQIGTMPRPWPAQVLLTSPYFPVDPKLYIKLGDSSLWRSDNGGLAWVRADNGLGTDAGNVIRDLEIVPLGDGYSALLAATDWALVISLDGGEVWYLVSDDRFLDIEVPDDFSSSLTIYAIDPGFMLQRTTDLGQQWTTVYGEWTSQVVVAPDFATRHQVTIRTQADSWRSIDGGDSWQPIASDPAGHPYYAYPVAQLLASPDFDQDGTVFAGPGFVSTDVILRSIDGGVHWESVTLPSEGSIVLALSPRFGEDRIVLAAVDNQLYHSLDGGDLWSPLGPPVPFQVDLLETSPGYPADQTLFAAGYGDGLLRSTNNGQSWTSIQGNMTPYLTGMAISPGYPADPTLFATVYNDGIFRSDNGGASWTNLPDPTFSPDFNVALSPAFDHDSTLFANATGISSGGAFRSEDRGETWIDITGGDILDYFIYKMAVSPDFERDRTIMTGVEFGPLYLSEDAGATWALVRGIPNGGAFATALSYKDGLIQLIASDQYDVYHTVWPTLQVPAIVSPLLEPDATGPVTATLPVVVSEPLALEWEASESAPWLEVLPAAGTLPDVPILTVDPNEWNEGQTTYLSLTIHWSIHQEQAFSILVRPIVVRSRLFMPILANQ